MTKFRKLAGLLIISLIFPIFYSATDVQASALPTPIFIVSRYKLSAPNNVEEIGKYDNLYAAFMDGTKANGESDAEHLSYQYVITQTADHIMMDSEYCYTLQNVNVLLKAEDGKTVKLERHGGKGIVDIREKAKLQIKDIILDGHSESYLSFVAAGELILSGATVVQNFVAANLTHDGSAIYLFGQTPSLKIEAGVVLTNNKSIQEGGVIHAKEGSIVKIDGAEITNNSSSKSGGAIYAAGQLNIKNTKLQDNQTLQKVGGAIYASTNATVEIVNTTFTHNMAASGGAIYTNASNMQINNCNFNNNLAQWGGCTIFTKAHHNKAKSVCDECCRQSRWSFVCW